MDESSVPIIDRPPQRVLSMQPGERRVTDQQTELGQLLDFFFAVAGILFQHLLVVLTEQRKMIGYLN